jgi:hypothetical protein
MPTAQQAASVGIMPTLNRKIATAAAAESPSAHGSTLASFGRRTPTVLRLCAPNCIKNTKLAITKANFISVRKSIVTNTVSKFEGIQCYGSHTTAIERKLWLLNRSALKN